MRLTAPGFPGDWSRAIRSKMLGGFTTLGSARKIFGGSKQIYPFRALCEANASLYKGTAWEALRPAEDSAMISFAISSDMDEALGSAKQCGFKRIRSWRVPPNWSRRDWFEEVAAVGTAAAWQAVCEFNPARGIPLSGFGYRRMMTRCLSRYRKEWRYALHLVSSDTCEEETTTFKHPDLAASWALKVNETHPSNDDLRGAVRALPGEQRRLIEQLFWEECTEAEVAAAIGTNQSTINRRKRAILNGLRLKLRDRNEFEGFSA